MANKNSNLGTQVTLRGFLNEKINETTGLQITLNDKSTPVYDVNVIWDGNDYYIAYTTESDGAADTLQRVEDVLPFNFVTTTDPSEVSEPVG